MSFATGKYLISSLDGWTQESQLASGLVWPLLLNNLTIVLCRTHNHSNHSITLETEKDCDFDQL